ISANASARAGDPLTARRPSVHSMSSPPASSRWAAIVLALARIWRRSRTTARPPHADGAAEKVSAAARQRARVSLLHDDCARVQGQDVGGDLGEGGLVPLAVSRRAGSDEHSPIRLHDDTGVLGKALPRARDAHGDTDP